MRKITIGQSIPLAIGWYVIAFSSFFLIAISWIALLGGIGAAVRFVQIAKGHQALALDYPEDTVPSARALTRKSDEK